MERQSRERFGSEIELERIASAARRPAAVLVQRVYDRAKAIGDALLQSVEKPSVVIRWPAGEDVEHRPRAIPFETYAETIGLIWLRCGPAITKHDVIFSLRHEIGTVFLPASGEYGPRVISRRRCFCTVSRIGRTREPFS